MKILPILLFCFLIVAFSQPKQRENPLDFVFNGECPPEYEACLPYANLSFRKELSSLKDEEIINRMNDFVQRNPEIFVKPVEVFKVDSKPRNFGLRTGEPFKKRETYLNVTLDYLISNDEINYEIMFPSLQAKKFPEVPNFNNSFYMLGDKTGYLPDAFRFMTNFLFHMYHLNDSFLRDSLIGLPLDFTQAPIMTMIPPEFTLFREFDVAHATIAFRKETYEALEYYNNALESAWTKSERKLFFNGRTKITMDDFVYAFYVMRTRGLSFQKQNKIVMLPIHHVAKNNDGVLKDNEDRYLGQMIDFHYRIDWDTENKQGKDIAVVSLQAYEKGQEIILNYKTGNTMDMFLFLGVVPKKNINDCFDIPMFNENDLRKMKFTFGKCARIKDFKRAYLIANLISMDETAVEDCKERTKDVDWNSDDFYKKVDAECVHPKWGKKQDIWVNTEDKLEEMMERLEAMRTTSLEYTNYRNSKKLPSETGQLIRTYVDRRIELTQRFMKEIKDLRKYSKKKQSEGTNKKSEL